MSKTIAALVEILDDGEFELVSYGLAPNPDGFCYEFSGDGKRDKVQETRLNNLLDSLNESEERLIKARYL
jgi:hypothetical protein